jgi:twitching motility protein PilU
MQLDDLLAALVHEDASDLYVTVGSAPTLNRGGEYVPVSGSTTLDAPGIEALIRAALPPSEHEAFERDGDANAAYALPGSDRFRVNAFRQRGEPGMVVRRIRTQILTLEQLGLPDVISRLALVPRGLVLVTGATGSGKSTTLAAMIDHRNERLPGHIVTLEDPIEFVHPHKTSLVSQREIGFDTPTYAAGLKNALRQAPNVLLIGEIRDREAAEAALQFADTGHLVLSTLHSTNAVQTMKRLINLFPPEAERGLLHQLSLNLRGIVSQRLLVRRDGKGRVAALEVLVPTPRIADLIKEGHVEAIRGAMTQARLDGCQTFDEHVYELYVAGHVTEEVAVAGADSANDVKLRIRLQSGEAATKTDIRITQH